MLACRAGVAAEQDTAAGRGAVSDQAPALQCAQPGRNALRRAAERQRPPHGALARTLQGALRLQAQAGPPGRPPHRGRLQGVLLGPHRQVHPPGHPALVMQLPPGGYHQRSACWYLTRYSKGHQGMHGVLLELRIDVGNCNDVK